MVPRVWCMVPLSVLSTDRKKLWSAVKKVQRDRLKQELKQAPLWIFTDFDVSLK